MIKQFFFRVAYKLSKNVPYSFGKRLRKMTAGKLFKRVGKNFSVGIGASFGDGTCLELSEFTNLGPGFSLTGLGTVRFGSHIMMGYECMFITTNHNALPGGGYGKDETKQITIGSHVWFGHRVIVLPGVTIGDHAIIGAGAVVSKNVPAFGVAVGNPARIVKIRNKKLTDRV
ncbi:MAG: acyltransferase [Desulfocapsa sp.]|uniref:Acyltransferase n=1 Tax=Desulfotalea psychrophila TaxID=84980 RepID=A0ABS3ATT5_9BACT|nr:acyltransferase [Desulfocapsa sp.]MBN4068514.1 acyltransferase [Desulfotalea psychrophila]